MEEHRQRVFNKRVIRKMFECEREEVIRRLEKTAC
jgi:hypothetical protein